jgi:hypothetical protein
MQKFQKENTMNFLRVLKAQNEIELKLWKY